MHDNEHPSQRGAPMIDHEHEQLLSLTEASQLLPGRPHAATLWRWRRAGVKGHRLESIAIGGRVYTSREAIARFLARINGAPVPSETPRQRAARWRRAEERARELGV